MKVVFYDDAVARAFEPFALTRPIASLATGMWPMMDRWAPLGDEGASVIAAPHLADFDEGLDRAPDTLAAGTIVINSRFAPRGGALASSATSWRSGGKTVAVRLQQAMSRAAFEDGTLSLDSLAGDSAADIEGWWHDEVWDFLRHLPGILTADIARIAREPEIKALAGRNWGPPSHAAVIGTEPVIIHCGDESSGIAPAVIEPHVVFDASAGPIFVDSGAHVHAFTRINGPCFIGRNATIMGGDITGCSIGPVSKIRGEISGSIVLGYSNKGHDGFVGNSYLGRWVNLGAGTVTSNLKNTYGEVSLWTPTGIRPTGLQFLGTVFGDHVKTGIGTKLTTGTVLGAGANVYGPTMPRKAVAPFSWGEGEPYDLYRVDKFLSTAETVMARRKMKLTERMKRLLTASFEQRWSVK
jgi:UDP-N-acetylglucosamine diphosphorylase / glucose-1-phosphate thymidylyltransferase / UDP-N-acetylgalactosamine diphosphorylase / glucosamine-1-phosphate N-acetyltransferase / galactosamine-1-phosphate N-acetyltransferase